KEPTADKPHLIVYQDYQCPWCAAYETAFGTPVEELVESGRITAEYRTTSFLDGNAEDGPSRRAAVAAAAADEVGKFAEYQRIIFANHKESSAAYPARQLRDDFAEEAGITGDALTTFQDLFDTRAFNDFAQGAYDTWNSDPVTLSEDGKRSTPVYAVSGERLPGLIDGSGQPVMDPTADNFYQVVIQAWEAGGKQIEK
ncbi:MAG TPA: thioredoxin domain-containing protein, partial [Arachnia sp.]|nr:thioredoxin domain-containing protein [Arachnia sp.]